MQVLLLWGGGGDYGDDASGPENKDKYVRCVLVSLGVSNARPTGQEGTFIKMTGARG